MESLATGRAWRAFTLVEMLVVVAIIAVLAAFLIPTVTSARRHVKEGVTKSELAALEAAMHAYFSDWGEYPPDRTAAPVVRDSAQCIVYYLGNKFRVADGFTHNGGPYFDFPPDRLIGLSVNPLEGSFRDALGVRNGTTTCYRFDNNDADQGSEAFASDPAPVWNVSNVHPTSVDIWSAGWDGEGTRTPPKQWPGDTDWVYSPSLSGRHPTQANVATVNFNLGDDIGNW